MKYKKHTVVICVIFIFLTYITLEGYQAEKEFKNQNTDNIIVNGNAIYLDSLTLRQKIAQMIIAGSGPEQPNFNILVGGIFLDKQQTQDDYRNLIEKYQSHAKIRLLVATDLEGAWSPFRNPLPDQAFPSFAEIATPEEAYEIGSRHGKLLKETGFNLNFAPVAELADNIYAGRAFKGTKQEINLKIKSYINGLQQNVMGTCKHYPGNSMNIDLHTQEGVETITPDDLEAFETCIRNNISAIMLGHHIAEGVLSSNGKPSSASVEIIQNLVDYEGLIIADEVDMAAIRKFYPDDVDLYIALINSGENMIIDGIDARSIYDLTKKLEKKVYEGSLSEEKINQSVRKILAVKGYSVV